MIQGKFKQLLARYDRVRAKLAKFVGSSTGPPLATLQIKTQKRSRCLIVHVFIQLLGWG